MQLAPFSCGEYLAAIVEAFGMGQYAHSYRKRTILGR